MQALKSTWISFAILLVIGVQAFGQTPQTGEAVPQTAQGAAQLKPEEDRPGLRAGNVAQLELQLDGVLSEPAWATAESITTMRTIEPEEGGEPVGKTIVKVLVSPKEIAIGIVCNDPDPSGIISFSKARDAELDDEDHVVIVLDTFGSDLRRQRSFLAHTLRTNPRPWSIVLMHSGPFASVGDRRNTEMRKWFLPTLERYDADLVLSGHDHSYARGRKAGVTYLASVSGPKYYESSGKDWRAGGATKWW